jgi:hypothetical protein
MRSIRLSIDILIWRFGIAWPLVILSLIVLGSWQVWGLPIRAKALATEQRMKVTSAESLRAIVELNHRQKAPTGQLSGIQQVQEQAIDASEVSSILKKIANLAKRHHIDLGQSEFQHTSEGWGGLERVQWSLPLRSTYPQFRSFVEDVLWTFPAVSVDQVSVHRDQVGQPQTQILVKLSLWVAVTRTLEVQPRQPTVEASQK